MVGHKRITGVMRENSLHHDGIAKPRDMSLQGRLVFAASTNVVTLGQVGISRSGQEFTLEHRDTLFETDVPAQHLWSPQSGKNHRVLWTHAFRETVK
jgi:hypothetical protein